MRLREGDISSPSRIRRYCSRACSAASRKTRVQRNCAHCSLVFEVHLSDVAQGRGRFCSRICAGASARKSALPRYLPCEQCGASFPTLGRAGKPRFCSSACFGLSQRTPPVSFVCESCGQACQRSHAAGGNRQYRFCSRSCASKARRTRFSVPCRECGSAVMTSLTLQASGKGRFCSVTCARRGRRPPKQRPCMTCGVDFSYSRGKRPAKYCSRACASVSMLRPRTLIGCRQCKRTMQLLPSQIARRRFCSSHCAGLARAPRRFRCKVCRVSFESRAWRKPRFCSLSCSNRGRQRQRDPVLADRDARILDLAAQKWKAPKIQQQIVSENYEWLMTPAAIRQVIHRAR